MSKREITYIYKDHNLFKIMTNKGAIVTYLSIILIMHNYILCLELCEMLLLNKVMQQASA